MNEHEQTSNDSASASAVTTVRRPNDPPVIAVDMPVMYEDEGQEEMGESSPHVDADEILHTGLKAHLANRPDYRVFSNLNLYYHPVDRGAYVSPDSMVVIPSRTLDPEVSSYRISEDGPAPVLTAEVLSRRSAQQQDLTNKIEIYSDLGVAEYLLVDPTGKFLAEKLLLKRRQADGTWKDERDPDGGVTSRLGFRLIIDADNRLRIVDSATGKRYLRPDEAEEEAEARRHAEERIQELEREITQLRSLLKKADNK